MKLIVVLGRILLAIIFVAGGANLFSKGPVGYAQSAGVPMPSVAVPLAGVFAVLGGLSVALGFKARLGAWLLVLFLLPVSFYMHAFWKIADPQAMMEQQVQFLKNMGLMGAALMITQVGSGPGSLKD